MLYNAIIVLSNKWYFLAIGVFMNYYIEKESRRYMAHIQEEFGDEVSVTSHLHIVCEILYCYCGNMTVHVGNNAYSFQAGELIVIPANTVHSITFHGQIEHRYLVVQFELGYIADSNFYDEYKCVLPFAADNNSYHKKIKLTAKDSEEIRTLLEQTASNFASDDFFKELRAKSDICNIVQWISKRICFYKDMEQDFESQIKELNRVRPAIDYIEENYASEISLQNLADICNYSYSHFSKVFIKAFSINPNTYISYTRIRKAEDLLKSTDMNISDIASAVGYNDVSYFIRVFRKLKGISPNKYRKSEKGI